MHQSYYDQYGYDIAAMGPAIAEDLVSTLRLKHRAGVPLTTILNEPRVAQLWDLMDSTGVPHIRSQVLHQFCNEVASKEASQRRATAADAQAAEAPMPFSSSSLRPMLLLALQASPLSSSFVQAKATAVLPLLSQGMPSRKNEIPWRKSGQPMLTTRVYARHPCCAGVMQINQLSVQHTSTMPGLG